MPSGPFAHVCMVVRDLEIAIEDWTKILRVLDPQSLEKRIVKYDEFSSGADAGMKWATFVNEYSTEIQFIQPAPGTQRQLLADLRLVALQEAHRLVRLLLLRVGLICHFS